ncbi:putative peptidyl-prolyl cis-trans isomerase [Actinoplanes missouriensis 431]|uniref:Putative peptidyl-prolyl cis-trans isomerase n=1 Tax=Actinoplanes missouriensis (strain ATCC 14538 / DSM 43046 / CBS 188.64 / JCM 3121 / NBRC 102363 / NCIMB 12654 / NRRL B-3342 / UNCC 431) TaxID=512565 RepID=I0HEQ6_ACTM4|nr:peptidylprolyl isomerase [Actinoplanes missouriensis]BAL91493.1 putative peptidyl-prolyl cis-trans isomerase [Actinoplanes missouriensis 431]
MAPSKDRQRKLARAKFDRQQARRAERERRRRRITAGLGTGLAVLLIVAGVAWAGGAFDSDDNDATTEAADICLWTPLDAKTNTDLKEVGTPPTKDLPETGTETMTITTDKGDPIQVGLDVENATCAAASFSYLAGKKFFDGTTCHEITTEGAVRCGDPTGTGNGGPTYSFYSENLPAAAPEPAPSASAAPTAEVTYPKGTVAMIGNPPGSNGSQFLLFFKDFTAANPQYTIVGTVTAGLDTLEKIGKIPTVETTGGDKISPKEKITIKSLTVGTAGSPAPSASAAQS